MESAVKFREGEFQNWLTVVCDWKAGTWKKNLLDKVNGTYAQEVSSINTVQGQERM